MTLRDTVTCDTAWRYVTCDAGLFSWGHMPYDDEIRESGADTPSLANMTAAALEILLARCQL